MQDIFNPITTKKPKVKVPKFKGKAKIELFEKGQKVKEIVEENMFTNALDDIFNPKRFMVMGDNENDQLTQRKIINDVLGGILLYENEIEENPDNLYPPLNNPFVGCAGDAYSGTDGQRGSLNVTESGYIDDTDKAKGYRWVWDFATDKANGKIGCICLTSRAGGNTGWGIGRSVYTTSSSDGTYVYATRSTLRNGYTNQGITNIYLPRHVKYTSSGSTTVYGYYIGQTSDGWSRFILPGYYSNQWYILEFPTENMQIGLENTTDFRYLGDSWDENTLITRFIRIKCIRLDVSNYDKQIVTYQNSTGKIFVFGYRKDGYDNNTYGYKSIDYWELDPDSVNPGIGTRYNLSNPTNITVNPGIYSSSSYDNKLNIAPFFGGFIGYTRSGSTYAYYYFPKTGGNGVEIPTLNAQESNIGNFWHIAEINGGAIIGGESNYRRLHAIDKDLTSLMDVSWSWSYSPEMSYSGNRITSDGDILEPSIEYSKSHTKFAVSASKLTPYMATINNLAGQVTKTNAQTMKITYEVTLAEGSV